MNERVFGGHDPSQGIANVVVLGVGVWAMMGPALEAPFFRWACGVLLLLMPLVYRLARYRLTVNARGIALRRAFGPIGWSRTTYNLEHSAELWEAWESPRAEGVYLDAKAIGEPDSPTFGPAHNVAAMHVLADQINNAIREARTEVAVARALQAEGFGDGDFRVIERSPGGPPRRLMNVRRVRHRGVEIPIASVFVFNHDGWVDPERQGMLQSIELAGTAVLPNAVEVGPGGHLHYFKGNVTVSGGLADRITVEGMALDGTKELRMNIGERYKPISYTLAEGSRHGTLWLPAGSSISPSFMDDGWYARVGGRVALRDVQLYRGDRIYFDKEWRPTMVSLGRTHAAVTRVQLSGELDAVPLRRNGRVDLRACRRRGLLHGT